MSEKLFEEIRGSRKPKEDPTLKKILEKVEALEAGPRKWRFTVKRDDEGRLSEILAEAE